MSQDDILEILSDQLITQKQICQALHIDASMLSHRLKSLMRKGLVERKTLDIKGRPFGYTRCVNCQK